MEPSANMVEYKCLVLKLTIKSKGLVRKAWKWLYGISRIEMDYYIFEQEISFILSRAENVQNRNFWKTVVSDQSNKNNVKTLDPYFIF